MLYHRVDIWSCCIFQDSFLALLSDIDVAWIYLYQVPEARFDVWNIMLKMDFRSGSDQIHIHLHFIAAQYLWNYALVEDIDNWTRSNILIVIYWNRQK